MSLALIQEELPFSALPKSEEALSGWRDVMTGPVETHEVSETHMGIFFGSHVEYLASRLAVSLDNAAAFVTPPKISRDR